MTQDEDPVFMHPESYGIENPEAPGEPKRDNAPLVSPVPGTGRAAREEHQREHDERGHTPSDSDYRDRREREELKVMRRDVDEVEDDLTP